MAFVDGSATARIELRNDVTPSVLMSSGASALITFGGVAELVSPVVPVSVVAIDAETIRVDFSGPLANEVATTFAANYELATSTPGAIAPVVNKVLLPDILTPEFLILGISEMTDGATYDFSVVGDVNGHNGVPVASDVASFVGVGVEPVPELVVATSSTTARVEFSEQMKPVGDLGKAAAYTFDNGLVVEAVVSVQPTFVELRTSEQDPSILYMVTLTGVFMDGANNLMTSPTLTAMLGFQPLGTPLPLLRTRMYNFLTEVIRIEDQRRGGKFVERLFEGPQAVWERTHEKILSLPTLWNVELIEDRLLRYLKNIVGWTRSLDAITELLDDATLRRLIASSVAFWKRRGPEDAIEAILRLTTGKRLRILNWFDMRWINDETQLGWDWEDNDSWVISDYTSKLRETVTLAGSQFVGTTFSDFSSLIAAGDYDGLVVFLAVNSTDINLKPPLYRANGIDRPMMKAGSIASVASNNVGRMILSAWTLNGIKPNGGQILIDTTLASGGVGNATVHMIARTVKNMGRRRDIRVSVNTSEVGALSISNGVRTLQEGDTVLAACFTTPLGAVPNAVAPMTNDALTPVNAGNARMRTGFFPGSPDGTMYEFGITGGSPIALTMALSLTGKDTSMAVSGDESVYQLRIVDDGTLNKTLVRSLVALTRPIGERVDILYLGFLDQFTTDDDNSQWTDVEGESVVEDGVLKLSDDSEFELSIVSVPQSLAWREYVVHTRLRITTEAPDDSSFFACFYYIDIDNYYYVEFTLDSAVGPTVPSVATVEVRSVVGGTDTLVESGTFPGMHRQVFYTLSVEIVRDDLNGLNEIRILIDENIVLATTDDQLDRGTIGVGHADGSAIEVDAVEMHFLPASTDFVGINNTGGALPGVELTPLPPAGDDATEECPVPTSLNKNMPALMTASNGDLATAIPMALDPAGHVAVDVNGLSVTVGDATTSQACYFSDDGGATARAIDSIRAGDFLYWNGVIAGYQLEVGWRIDFNYSVRG